MAWTPEEEQRRKRRRRLVRGLLVGGAALGLPALANVMVARRAKALPASRWGDPEHYDWLNGTVTFRRLGQGPPLVLLHSFGAGHASREWQAVAELMARDHEVFVPDLLGWGDSDRPGRTYDGELYIQLLSDFLIDVVQRRATVVATGLTCAYSIQVAVDQPESVRALGLVVPLGVDLHGDEPDLKDAIVHRLLKLPVLGTSALNVFTTRRGISHHLRREVFARSSRVTEELIDRYYRASHLPGGQAALAAYLAGYLNHSVRDLLARLEQPVWIAWGREATSPAIESADLWLRELPQARLEVFPDSASQPHAEVAESFASGLREFLQSLNGT